MRHIHRAIVIGSLVLAWSALPAGAVLPEKTIYDLQRDQFTLGDSCLIDSVVVIGVDVRPSTFGVYVQEPPNSPPPPGVQWPAYSGILAYRGGTFPAYNNSLDPVQVGDLVNVRGVFADFAGLAELDFATLNKLGTVAPIVPIKLPIDSLKTSNPRSEQWEGVLVKMDSVKCTSIDPVFTRTWRAHHFAGPAAGRIDSISVYEKMIANQVTPAVGDLLLSVTGVGDFVSGARFIAPRGDDDLVFLSPAPPPVPTLAYSSATNNIKIRFNVQLNATDAVTTSHYSLSTFQAITGAVYDNPNKTVTLTIGTPLVPSTIPHVVSLSGIRNYQNVVMSGVKTISLIGGISTIVFVQTPRSASDDTSQVVGQRVSIRGVVTETTGVDFPSSIGGFYMQQRGATQYAGIFVFGPPVTPVRGDSVFVSGSVSEFGVGPETEITSVAEVTILGTNRPPIPPIPVTVAQIGGCRRVTPCNDAVGERYESSLVKVSGVTVLTPLGSGSVPAPEFPGQPFDVAVGLAGTDTVRVDDLAINERGYTPHRGNVLDVTGIMRFSGSVIFQRLQPRNWSDPINGGDIFDGTGPTDVPAAGFYVTRLLQNHPNPFNPATRIAYTIGRPGHASLRVYDLHGRLVATLLDRDLGSGPGSVVWNGVDARGRLVPSGVYVYRLLAADGERSQKMVLLK